MAGDGGMDLTFETLLVESPEPGLMVITMNRPERLNAMNTQMMTDLRDLFTELYVRQDLARCIVLTGAGERGFCPGADLKERDGMTDEVWRRQHAIVEQFIRAMHSCPIPIIAAVNGASVGVGLTMILPCDVIIASEEAKFGMGFIKMGLVPELASSHFLAQRMGFGRASEVCLTGKIYTAREAREMDLVDHLVPHEQLLEAALTLARTIAANPSPQLRWIKQLLSENACETDLNAVQQREMALLQKAYATPEHKEAVAAFLEKRSPDYRAARARAAEGDE